MWRPDPLLRAILWWTSILTGPPLWVPLVRGVAEGQVYQWSFVDGIGGRGTGGSYWFLIASIGFMFTLFYLARRGARPPFHWLLAALHGAFTAGVLYTAVARPDQLFFEGATLGVRFSFATIGPVIFLAALACTLYWVIRDLGRPRRRAAPLILSRAARVRLVIAIAVVPLQAFLLRSEGPFGGRAMIGVLLTIGQWFIVTQGVLKLPAVVRMPDAPA